MREKQDLQLWGGIECTVNRVGDRFHDQFTKNGHFERLKDLDLIAELGIKTLRYPVLWERTAPERPDERNWQFPDERLNRLRELGISPIAGLVHHGSGPHYTNLLDESFAPGLAEHARAVAERYPWIEAYTPVNEPLTTARFSALYGHWYPHTTDEPSFARALLNQVRATVLSMEAIRKVNPDARLVQTDDLGKTHSTERLRYQAEFDNVRRWTTWDLLCGKVDPDHRMWRHFLSLGIEESELGWFLDHPCPPDVVGVNYYLTSERFLDHRLDRYPAHTQGGNGRDQYADIEAVRVLAGGIEGPASLLQETWERYGLPVAVTECHLGCTREEQVRWLGYVWHEAEVARQAGADVRAVTVWSMFGAHDWCSLLTCDANRYEPGVFDVRAPEPRPTALAYAVKSLAQGEPPCAEGEGWWERPIRLLYPPVIAGGGASSPTPTRRIEPHPTLMIVGDRQGLASLFAKSCEVRGIDHVRVAMDEIDVTSPPLARRALDLHHPWAVIDLSSEGNGALAEACAEVTARLLTLSTSEVFDGRKLEPYVESDPVRPCPAAERENAIRRVLPEALIVRPGELFGTPETGEFFRTTLQALRKGMPVLTREEPVTSPTYAPDLVETALDLLIDGVQGALHLVSEPTMSPTEFGRRIAEAAEVDPGLIVGVTGRNRRRKGTPRPVSLRPERMWVMPRLDDAITKAITSLSPVQAEPTRGYVS